MDWKRSAACAMAGVASLLLVSGCGSRPKGPAQATPASAAQMSEMGRRTGMGQSKSKMGMPGAAGMQPPSAGGMSPAGMPPGGMPGMPPGGMRR
jgi:hypothetical protein